uniref:Reverse transcriptase domain-containing protein n=1 Tax=Tanacetum cinerariifolium TaxID=118510 RepID=A0A6L2NAK8_TANCI|nr:reverse transcriptase domain-containing protein [Tanacetum cinerariifolium]
MKKLIAELPMLTAPKEKEELIIYLVAAKEAISAVLMTERDGKQVPIYFVSRALQGQEINYTPMEKLILALVSASKRLKRYFQAHTIIVITDQPIKQILSNPENIGRLLKWSFELEEHDIHYRLRTSVKRQILADFIMERPEDDFSNTSMEDEEELPHPWILFKDGSSCIDGSGAYLILTNPEGMEFTYALRFRFDATNNEAEYEALIAGLKMRSKWRREQKSRRAKQDGIYQFHPPEQTEEEGRTWMTPIHEYLTKELLPEEKRKARSIRRKAELNSHHISIAILQVRDRHSRTFSEGLGKVKFLIVAIDYFTKWVEAKPVAAIIGAQIKKFVWDNIVYRFGLPGEIISDNGKQFRDNPFKDWCEKLSIHQCFAFVKHPQANGLVERANRSLGEGIKARNEETPFLLTYGTEAVIPVEIGMPTLRTAEVEKIKNDEALEINLDLLEERRDEAAIQEAKSKAKKEKYYNTRVCNTSFKPGDLVYQNNEASYAEDGVKLGPK